MYSTYLKEVLGVHSILQSLENTQANVLVKKKSIYFYLPYMMNEAEKELLLKMISAMKLGDSDYQIFESEHSLPQESEFHFVVGFDYPAQTQSHIMFTYGPRSCLEDANLKKKTWADLQKVMKEFHS